MEKETIITNKKFIKFTTILVGLLCLLVLSMLVNQLKGKHRKGDLGGTISVSASADVVAVPDIAMLNITIQHEASTTKDAQSALNDTVTKTLAYLSEQKIEEKDIDSQYGGVTPKYKNNQRYCISYPCVQDDPVVVGYTATQSISIKVRDVDNANEVRTGLANLGITNISGPTFSIDDEELLKDEARSLAIKKARDKAKVLAKDLKVRLGDVVEFSENSGGYPMMYAKTEMSIMADASNPAPMLPKGEDKITSSVTITYEIR